MAEILDMIIAKEGRKFGILDKTQLVRTIIADFIERYEKYNDILVTRAFVRSPIEFKKIYLDKIKNIKKNE